MAISAVFEPASSRVRLAGSGLGAATWATVFVRRAGTATWQVVRGGYQVPVTSGTLSPIYDHEFPVTDSLPGTVEYLLNSSDGTGNAQASVTCSIAGQCWLKFCGFPFLNRRLTVVERGDVSRDSRGELLPIASNRLGIAVQEFMSGRSYQLVCRTDTWADYKSLDDAVSLGSIVWLHADEAALGAPAMYATVTSIKSTPGPRRSGGGTGRRYTTLTLEECARPGYFYAGALGTWQTLLTTYPTWQGVLDAQPTWQDVLVIEGSPADVVVI